jgi:serine/threonine-protein kinase RsbW
VEHEYSVCSNLESAIESVDRGEELVLRFLEEAGFATSDDDLIGLAVREVLINAIKHGNRFDPNKKVRLRLSKSGALLSIEVDDEGPGFRLKDVPDPCASENRERRSGRGLALAAGIMDELVVEDRSPHGALIRMVKRFDTAS